MIYKKEKKEKYSAEDAGKEQPKLLRALRSFCVEKILECKGDLLPFWLIQDGMVAFARFWNDNETSTCVKARYATPRFPIE